MPFIFRNGFDFTNNFGSDPYSGLLTPDLHKQFRPDVKEVILDGEVVVWSKTHKTIISKGNTLRYFSGSILIRNVLRSHINKRVQCSSSSSPVG